MPHDTSLITRYQGRFLSLLQRGHWEYASRPNCSCAVMVIPLTQSDELVLISQHRIPVQATVLEFPAGLAGDGADPDEDLALAAKRELEEETGFAASSMLRLAQAPASAGLTDEYSVMYLATGLSRLHAGGGVDEHENISVHIIPRAEVDAFIAACAAKGWQIDVKIYAGLYLLDRHLKNAAPKNFTP